jgi:hypothetical protein
MPVDLVKAKLLADESRKQEEDRKFRNGETLKIGVGNTYTRLLPPDEGSGIPWVELYQHFGFLKNRKRPLMCPRTFDKNALCPLCEYVGMLYKRETTEDKTEARAKRGQFSCLSLALKLDVQGNHDGKVYRFYFKKTLRDKFLGWFENSWYLDFTDETTGRDMVIKRTGEGQMDTEYSADLSPEKKPIASWDTVKSKMPKLSEIFKKMKDEVLPYEKLSGILHGTYELEDDKPEDTTKRPQAEVAKPSGDSNLDAARMELEMLKSKQS